MGAAAGVVEVVVVEVGPGSPSRLTLNEMRGLRMADRPEYTEIEHTADVGIALAAPDLRSAYACAAAAAFDMVADLDRVAPDLSFDLRVEGRVGDREHLMVRWLSELLYLHSSERVLLSEFEILELRGVDERVADNGRGCGSASRGVGIDDGSRSLLVARVKGERYDPRRHCIKLEIKAPTYHQLAVEQEGGHWSVRIIFDT